MPQTNDNDDASTSYLFVLRMIYGELLKIKLFTSILFENHGDDMGHSVTMKMQCHCCYRILILTKR